MNNGVPFFPRKRILVVGDIILDEYISGDVDRISPEAPVPIVAVRNCWFAPGGAANVAANIASLGGKVTLAGLAGADAHADILHGILREKGIDCDLLSDPSRPTITKTRIISAAHHIARFDREDSRPMNSSFEQAMLKRAEAVLPAVELVVLSDYAKGVLTDDLTSNLIRLARAAGKPVLVDPKGADFSKYMGCSIIAPNTKEAIEASGRRGNADDVLASGEWLLDRMGGAAVLITRGERGMALFRRGRAILHIASTARQVSDVTGAGDTVMGVLALCLACGQDIEDSVALANYAAGLVVAKAGTATLTVDDMAAFAQSSIVATQYSIPERIPL